MKLKFILLLSAFCLIIPLVQAGSCGNAYCEDDLGETTVTCCVDCGCTNNQTCYGLTDDTKECVDPYCGDDFCDETLDENSIPEEYWKNCCDDCGCHGSDKWEAEKMLDYEIPYYRATPDDCYDNRCDGCNIDQNCDDGDNCTIDECVYNAYLNKSICLEVPIIKCIGGDACCPSGCTYANDTDCTGFCGNKICEANENCENCEIDCNCDFGFECLNKTCRLGEGYCEVRGEVEDGAYCDGKSLVAQSKLGASCNYNYECLSRFCENSVCSEVSKEAKEFYFKIGLLAVALAGLFVYFIVVVQKFWEKP